MSSLVLAQQYPVSFGLNPLPTLKTPGALSNTYTPSDAPLSPFGHMAAGKRDLLDQIGDIAGKASDIVTLIKSPAGTRLAQPAPLVATQTPLGNFNFENNSIFKNPVFIGGVALFAFYMLRK